MMKDGESGYKSMPNGKPAIREVNRANLLNYKPTTLMNQRLCWLTLMN